MSKLPIYSVEDLGCIDVIPSGRQDTRILIKQVDGAYTSLLLNVEEFRSLVEVMQEDYQTIMNMAPVEEVRILGIKRNHPSLGHFEVKYETFKHGVWIGHALLTVRDLIQRFPALEEELLKKVESLLDSGEYFVDWEFTKKVDG